MNEYQPVDCNFHSELELAIMHKKIFKISWNKQGEKNDEKNDLAQMCKPIDLVTRNHEEFLIIEDQESVRSEVRLDHIMAVSAVSAVSL